ncbi:MAG: hypothetical protein PHW45_04360 [Candidatus ainarchaeum sp.]|nr:hypothetical protein [Candidatus ainarchaeum sp.]MDD3085461.1 hypothetical protein [Candidatus ainarchaeum sp.]MDD4221507.1 hypothetical protein [Candidatus ainarchaeum sp.]MDD4663025.1 hypothetical protein [Candidatus ainarchaeum sp.]
MKIELTSTVFYYICKKLEAELHLGYINSVQTINKDVWKVKIHRSKTKQLIVTPQMCLLSNLNLPVGEIGGFEKYLKKKLYNQRIHEIGQDKNNRLIYFRLDKYYLIFEFFSSSNIILTDLEFKIITSKQKEEWKDRVIKRDEIYLFPAGKDIKEVTKSAFNEQIAKLSQKEKILFLAREYNIAPIESKKLISENEKEIYENLLKLYTFKDPKIAIEEKENKIVFYIDYKVESLETKNLFEDLEKRCLSNFEERVVEKKNTKKDKLIKILREQENTKKKFLEKIKDLENEGEIIYSNYLIIESINKNVNSGLEKKIKTSEIINKINDNLEKIKANFKVKDINQKTKKYTLLFEK